MLGSWGRVCRHGTPWHLPGLVAALWHGISSLASAPDFDLGKPAAFSLWCSALAGCQRSTPRASGRGSGEAWGKSGGGQEE